VVSSTTGGVGPQAMRINATTTTTIIDKTFDIMTTSLINICIIEDK
jgi:hypothetical protein